MRTGVFGGTFDPPHVGHLIVAQDAATVLGLERVLFIPAARPPHKQRRRVSPPALRARMIELALEGEPRFVLDTLELDREGPSYTVDTLRALRAREPATEFCLLVGADQYAELHTWHEAGELRRHARIAVLTRGGGAGIFAEIPPESPAVERPPGTPAATPLDDGGDVAVEVTRIDISATAVRARVASGLPIRYLVPDAVERFIRAEQLYVRNGGSVEG